MQPLKGTHGTTETRAFSIKKNGFKISLGRVGNGVYFWCDGPYAEKLAEAWWEFCSDSGDYNSDPEKDCAILITSLNISENEYLDLEQKEIKSQLATLAVTKLRRPREHADIHAVRTLFIRQLETKLRVTFKVIETSVSPPPKRYCEFYPIELLGAPHCYLALDNSCIVIEAIRIFKN
jgi:hypothetical protein